MANLDEVMMMTASGQEGVEKLSWATGNDMSRSLSVLPLRDCFVVAMTCMTHQIIKDQAQTLPASEARFEARWWW
jgi:hypothetical protein